MLSSIQLKLDSVELPALKQVTVSTQLTLDHGSPRVAVDLIVAQDEPYSRVFLCDARKAGGALPSIGVGNCRVNDDRIRALTSGLLIVVIWYPRVRRIKDDGIPRTSMRENVIGRISEVFLRKVPIVNYDRLAQRKDHQSAHSGRQPRWPNLRQTDSGEERDSRDNYYQVIVDEDRFPG